MITQNEGQQKGTTKKVQKDDERELESTTYRKESPDLSYSLFPLLDGHYLRQ